jgi:hypothetical protein
MISRWSGREKYFVFRHVEQDDILRGGCEPPQAD